MPARGWMNDPNGLVFHRGEWHLFYQHNPSGDAWGNIAWGHAVSRDLVGWEELGIALAPHGDELPFSGSVVVDGERLVAVYTAARPGNQSQALAVSADRGRTFTRRGTVLDIGSADFRDPKVFRHDGAWVMAVAMSVERRIRFYRSDDLSSWSLLSDFGSADVPDGVWECPDLFALGERWVLIVSIDPGIWYFLGDFDGTRFVAERHARLDHGADLYAAVTFNGTPRRVLIGWMNNPSYAQGRPWRSAMSIPRELSLAGDRIVQRPVVRGEAHDLRGGDVVIGDAVVGHDGERVFVERQGPPWFAGRHSAPARSAEVELLLDGALLEVFADGGEVVLSEQLRRGDTVA